VTNTVIGKPEATVFIKHNVVRRTQSMITTVCVEVSDYTGFDIDFLNSSTDVLRRIKLAGKREPCHVNWGEGPAVVAHVQEAVWTHCKTIGKSNNIRNL
jgi:hypothetical protein